MPRFSVDDVAEPPPPRWRRRAIVAVVVAAVLAGVVVLLAKGGPGSAGRTPAAGESPGAGQSSSSPSPSPSAAPAGPVKGVLFAHPTTKAGTSATYTVGVASETAAHPRTLTSVTIGQGQTIFAAASPDRSKVLLADGTELDLATGRLSSQADLLGEIARQPWVAGSDTILTLTTADGSLVQPNLSTRGISTLPGSASAFAADPNFAAVSRSVCRAGRPSGWELGAAGVLGDQAGGQRQKGYKTEQ